MKLDPEQIYAIIQSVIKFIQECKAAKATDETVEAEFTHPSARTQLRLQREAKRVSGLRGVKWHKAKDGIMAQIAAERKSFTKLDIKHMIAEATDSDE